MSFHSTKPCSLAITIFITAFSLCNAMDTATQQQTSPAMRFEDAIEKIKAIPTIDVTSSFPIVSNFATAFNLETNGAFNAELEEILDQVFYNHRTSCLLTKSIIIQILCTQPIHRLLCNHLNLNPDEQYFLATKQASLFAPISAPETESLKKAGFVPWTSKRVASPTNS